MKQVMYNFISLEIAIAQKFLFRLMALAIVWFINEMLPYLNE